QSGDDGDNKLDLTETWIFTALYTIKPTDTSPLINNATATGNHGSTSYTDTDEHSLEIAYNPVLLVDKTGPVNASVGQLVTYTITVQHHPSSDHSPVLMTGVSDSIAGTATYVSGDAD